MSDDFDTRQDISNYELLKGIMNNLAYLNQNIESIKKSLEDIAYYFNMRIEMYEKEGKPF